MKTDGNGRKNLIFTSISIFFGGNRIGFGKYGHGNGIGFGKYWYGNRIGLRGSTKRTNTNVEPQRITRSNILEYTLTKSQNNIHV